MKLHTVCGECGYYRGKLAVESTPGVGSHFHFTLTLECDPAMPVASPTLEIRALAGKRVALEIGGFAFLLLMKKLTLKRLWGKAGAAVAAGVLAAVLAFQGFGLALTGLNAIAAPANTGVSSGPPKA